MTEERYYKCVALSEEMRIDFSVSGAKRFTIWVDKVAELEQRLAQSNQFAREQLTDGVHHWAVLDVGNWYTEYQCTKCNMKWLDEPEDMNSPPKGPCNPNAKENRT